MITLLGWTGTVLILISYALVGKYGSRQFDIANAALFPLVALPSVLAGVWSAVTINIAFGLIALWRVVCH